MKKLCIGALLFAGLVFQIQPGERTAEEILKGVDSVRAPGPNFMFDLTVVSTAKGKKPNTQKFTVSVRDFTKSLVRFTDPPENRGRVLLMVGQNLWIQIPTTNQPLRISPQQRLAGQASNGDVARVVYSYDYTPVLKGTELVDGKLCNELELTAKTPDATYGRILLWADASSDDPIKAEFYSDDKLLKSAVYKGYQVVMGKARPMHIEISDAVAKGDVTSLDQQNLRVANLPASDYEKDNLKYVR